MEKKNILIVDDEENMCRILSELLTRAGYSIYDTGNAKEALKIFKNNEISLVITDLIMPGINGLQLLSMVKEIDPALPVILITAYGTVDTAVEAMKQGAYDYILKPFDNEEILFVIKKAIASNRYRNKQLRSTTLGKLLIGSSSKMEFIYKTIDKIAESSATVLIIGETGTGKELVAREIHDRSRRSDGPFICVNCAALPDTLLESELFGYEKGAFTGALNSKPGRFELAAGGTIFLDEIGDMSLLMQAKLLRVMQDKTIIRLGGTKSIKVDLRIITATNKNLETACQKGSFRQDLYYRINVLNIKILPLRDHKEDIPEIANYFIEYLCKKDGYSIKKLSLQTMSVIMSYDWPGNVRELENVIERAVVLSSGDEILPGDLGLQDIKTEHVKQKTLKESVRTTTAQMEKQAISKALNKCKGNRTKAAKILGISRRSLLNKIKLYKLENLK
ncbi:Regulatory protein AtoC [subsurface metagenome]